MISPSTFAARATPISRCLAVLLFASCTAGSFSGEKIIFSGRADGRRAVDLSRRDPSLERGVNTPKLPGDSAADGLNIAPAAPAPARKLTKREREELEERRDWAFRDPAKAGAKEAGRDSSRDNEPEGNERRKTAVERFVEGGSKDDADGASREKSADPRAKRDTTPRTVMPARDFLGDTPEQGSRQPTRTGPDLRGFELTGRVALDPTRGGARNPIGEFDVGAARPLGGSLSSGLGTDGLAGAPAPGTRIEISTPGAATRIYLQTPGAVVPGVSKGIGLDVPRAADVGAFEAKAGPGASAAAPSTEPPKRMEPRPTVLEVPKRKF